MWAPFYFAPRYFAPRYWPVGAGGIPAGGVYWPRYFAPGYFAPRYWPGRERIGTSASFQADGVSTAVFQTAGDDVYFRADGVGDCSWFLAFVEATGFRADGSGTAEFISPGGFRADGSSTADFVLSSRPAPTGFRADGTSTAQFIDGVGVGDGCITPPAGDPALTAPASGIANWAL